MATGVFHTAQRGQSLQYAARVRRQRAITRFAKELAASAGKPHDGNIRVIAERLGISTSSGHAMLQRIRRDLGPQAR